MTQRVLALVTIRMELPLAKITRDGDKSKSGGERLKTRLGQLENTLISKWYQIDSWL